MTRIVGLILLLLLAPAAGAAPAPGASTARSPGQLGLPRLTAAQLTELQAFIAGARTELGVPGAAIGLVEGGTISLLAGDGVREAGQPAPVTPDTAMMIGSLAKPLTSVLTGTLVDAGDLTWDTPVQQVLPDFATADPSLTASLTVADLGCACAGLSGRDPWLMWNADTVQPEDLVDSLAAAPIISPYGEFTYASNIAQAIQGYATGAASAPDAAAGSLGAAYATAMQARVLTPAGMTHTTLVPPGARAARPAGDDVATAHSVNVHNQNRPIAPELAGKLYAPYGPAAGWWSTARDMTALMRVLLAAGVTPDGTQVISPAQLETMWAPRSWLPAGQGLYPYATGYGIGWFNGDLYGHRMVGHSGATIGYYTTMMLLPEADLGLVVLTNGAKGAELAFAIQGRVIEMLFGLEPQVPARVMAVAQTYETTLAGLRAQLAPPGPASSLAAPYLGWYDHPELGEFVLTGRGHDLVVDAGEFAFTVQLAAGGNPAAPTFYGTDALGLGTVLTLQRGATGEYEAHIAWLYSGDAQFTATRLPEYAQRAHTDVTP